MVGGGRRADKVGRLMGPGYQIRAVEDARCQPPELSQLVVLEHFTARAQERSARKKQTPAWEEIRLVAARPGQEDEECRLLLRSRYKLVDEPGIGGRHRFTSPKVEAASTAATPR